MRTVYTVKVGLGSLTFHFDTFGDAIDFTAVCIENGHRVTIIPETVEEDENDEN